MPKTYLNTFPATFNNRHDFEVIKLTEKPLIKEEEKCERKFYPMSELRSHTVKSTYEDYKSMEIVAVFSDGTQKEIPNWIRQRLPNLFPSSNPYTLGYHPDNFWYALNGKKMVWCESGLATTERPQLNRYNALTLKKGED